MAQTQAVDNWNGEDHFNSGRKLMGTTSNMNGVEDWNTRDGFFHGRKLMESTDASGAEIAIYIIVLAVFLLIVFCCRLYCRRECKTVSQGEDCSDDCCDECCIDCWNEICQGCCDADCCPEDDTLTNRRHQDIRRYGTREPVQQQPRHQLSFTNFGDLSTESQGTTPSINRSNFSAAQNAATIFASDSFNSPSVDSTRNASREYNVSSRDSRTHGTREPVQQQTRHQFSFTNFGDLSTESQRTTPSINRSNFPASQNAATIFASDSFNSPSVVGVRNASQEYNVTSTPSEFQLFDMPSESQVYNIPTAPTPLTSMVGDALPPDYDSVVFGNLTQGNDHTPYPKVIQKEHSHEKRY